MKKSLVISIIIHSILFSLVAAALFLLPDEKKSETIKLKLLMNPPEKLQIKSEPLDVPQKETELVQKQPEIPVPTPRIPQKIQPVNKPAPVVTTPIVPIAVAPQQKVLEIPVQKVAVTPPTPPKVVLPKPAIIETVKGDPKAKENYIAYLRQFIDERKIYPKNAKRLKQMGTVTVKFRVLEDGTIKNISIVDSSGFDLLDQAAKNLLENIAHVKALPKEMGDEPIDLTLPIEYTLR
ncbi:energy transducer TonB [Sulfuricurvum sp.]|uniref:energy transducer TonB n=1 Tax=Sulfuricurvum sp. TaxID=2025608 RepID=UPI0026189519|nr:energy transducer TonB [Sulfuricurvum sp.]MDD2781981.1 energy transducer TonB [Sulfuricurvum sp.]